MATGLHFGPAETERDLLQIIGLQRKNLPHAISEEERLEQGFVTVEHDPDLLAKMNHPHPHALAKDGDLLAGYALVMLRSFGQEIPVLAPMFEEMDSIPELKDGSWFVMGQICVDKAYRGKGVFQGLYEQLRSQMQGHFSCVVTEVASRNTRSLRAHERIGFKGLRSYPAPNGEHWEIIYWDWK